MEELNQSSKLRPEGSMKLFMRALMLVGLCLLLLIPLLMISGLANERKREAESVQGEITDKWGQAQNVTTPILVVPYTPQGDSVQTKLYVLPREINATARLNMELRHRSIYQVPVYTAQIMMKGAWYADDIHTAMKEYPGTYRWEKAKVAIATSDPVGYRDLVYITLNGEKLRMKSDGKIYLRTRISDDDDRYGHMDYAVMADEASTVVSAEGTQSVLYPITVNERDSQDLGFDELRFECPLTISGSQKFGFLAAASSSTMQIKGNWVAPSFQGRNLPLHFDITQSDFSADWKTIYADGCIEEESFGSLTANDSFVDFVNPADHYARTDRSIKYGILVIVLSLLSVFLLELSLYRRGESINMLYYLLSGLSLVLFYSLLLSFSEIIGFGWAYLTASVMTVGLNFFFFRTVLRSTWRAFIITGIMSFLYLFVYTLMQMESYALLAGSLGLFVILTLVMFYTVRIIRH